MLVTEKEAESRICPMEMVDAEGDSTCWGQECMAWRWFDGAEVAEDKRRGYCGMAGVPGVGM